MEQHGRNLAAAHRLAPGRAPDRLLARLAENEGVLVEVCDLLTAAVTANRRITPAAEWLLDNFYLIEEQIRTAKRHLPKGYSRELPRLAHGPSAGLPRVYDLAFEAISHGDGRVDAESLSRFVAAYQTVTPLKLGELWAIPIMLRLALIENLRRVGGRDRGRHDRPQPRRRVGGPDDGRRRARSQEPDPGDRGHGALEPADGELVRRRARAPAAGTERRAGAAAHLDRAAAVRVGLVDRAAGAVGNAGAGRRPGLDQQHHRQPALPGLDGLARVRRDDERRRAEAAGGSGRRSTAGWTSRPATATGTSSRRSRRASPLSESEVARKAIQLAHEAPPAPPAGRRRRSDRPRRLLPDRPGPAAARAGGAMRVSAAEALRRVGTADPAAALPRRDRRDHGGAHRRPRWRRRAATGSPTRAARGARHRPAARRAASWRSGW